MFCPLCRSEFRAGFAQCADCHVPLVNTLHEARAASAMLWKGNSQTKLDQVLAALDKEKIPSRFKEMVNSKPSLSISILGVLVTPVRATFEYEVWVFRADLRKAKQAIASVSTKGNWQ